MTTLEEKIGVKSVHGANIGEVKDDRDPLGRHRLRIEVPGLVELSSWAYPITGGGGSPQRGGHICPVVGSEVVVWFVGGNLEYPIYAGAWWGKPPSGESQAPQERRANGDLVAMDEAAEPEKVQKLQIGRLVITMDERERDDDLGIGQLFSIEDTVSGDALTYDFETNAFQMKASFAIRLVSEGIIDIEAAQVQINGRRAMDLPRSF